MKTHDDRHYSLSKGKIKIEIDNLEESITLSKCDLVMMVEMLETLEKVKGGLKDASVYKM